MRICFVGIGSIAQRHVRNLREICKEMKQELVVDALRRPGSENHPLNNLFDHVFFEYEKLPSVYDAVFITNPTKFHLDTLEALQHHSNCFFIEKPVADLQQRDKILFWAQRKDKLCYVACPLRYTAVINHLKNSVVSDKIYGVRCISSSYLPDWRPGIDYRTTYSASRKLGGGVSIDLIHEWDYIKYLFGIPRKILYASGKKSNLQLDCEDSASYIAEYPDKLIELHLDYFGRKAIREIMIFKEDDTVVCDLVNSSIKYLKSGETIQFNEDRNTFQKRELQYFLELIDGKTENTNDINEAYITLKLTQGVVEEK